MSRAIAVNSLPISGGWNGVVPASIESVAVFKITGFGACMIAGFPHRYEDSCFYQAMERLKNESGQIITPAIITLGGFPITHAAKHLAPRCLDAQPDIVVLQFATTDLVVPVRSKHRRARRGLAGRIPSAAEREACDHPANAMDQLRWQIDGMIGDLLQLAPVTPPEIYLQTMTAMAGSIAEHHAIPVVLSPFIFGGRRSNRIAGHCAQRLPELLASVPKARYVDVYSALSRHRSGEILLRDRCHLTLKGQAIVGDRLFETLATILNEKTRNQAAR